MRDVTATLVGFARTLRAAGVGADAQRLQTMVRALDHLDVLDPSDVYWAGRLTLCAERRRHRAGPAGSRPRPGAASIRTVRSVPSCEGAARSPGCTTAPTPTGRAASCSWWT